MHPIDIRRQSPRRSQPGRPRLEEVLRLVHPRIATALRAATAEYKRLGVRHALCGGLAVGAYGHPRATRDVDFLVGDEAFDHHGPFVTLRVPFEVNKVPVDAVSVPQEGPFLAAEFAHLAESEGVPVVSLPGLVYMKLLIHRPQDRADVVALLQAGADEDAVRAYLAEHAPGLLPRFEALAAESAETDRGAGRWPGRGAL